MELDKRVGEYAAAIVRAVDLLLESAANLNKEQQQWTEALKRDAVLFQSLFNESITAFAELTPDTRIVAFDLRRPLSNIGAFCELLLSGELGFCSQSQMQVLHQIKAAQDFIMNAFAAWLNPSDETDIQPT